MDQKGYGLIVAVIFLLVILAGVLGLRYFSDKKFTQDPGRTYMPPSGVTLKSSTQQPAYQQTTTQQQTVQDATTNWVFYRNEQRGFQLQYPTNLIHQSKEGCSNIASVYGDEILEDHQAVRFAHSFVVTDKGESFTLTDFYIEICMFPKDYQILSNWKKVL